MLFAGLNIKIRSLALMTACSLLVGGCGFNSDLNSTAIEPASQSIRVGLDGDLSGYQPVEFESKPFTSLVQHTFCEEGGDYDPCVSNDNKLITFSSLRHSPNPDIFIKQINGFVATRLTSDPASEIQPAFSPNNDKIAYASNRSGSWDIWVVGLDGSSPTRLTSGVSNDIHPSWSPDGKEIVYCSFGPRSKQWELWTVNLANPSLKKWIGYGLFPNWSPNPKINKIVFQRARYRGSRWFSIWTVDILNGEAKYETEIVSNVNYACITPAWSADASMISYCSVGKNMYDAVTGTNSLVPDAAGEDVWVIDVTGRNNHRVTGSDAADFSPVWSPDGRLFYCSDRNYIDNIWSVRPVRVNLDKAEPFELSNHPLGGGIKAN